ncbi:MAG: tRNA (adenosine(37)-N6)-threonylcarbamoyltransferase complex dimerization subunit type 1 TsaB [Desulfovibrio sp.]|nr:tRNA (adenosine(37)-N6)-threonylcarbamoyltransferase complex dimerization subunit type 1 TsaB [Desulfovibrio sp.]
MKAYSTGLELVLNTAEGLLQIVVTDDENLLCAQEWDRPKQATEILAPALREICATLRIAMGDFCRVACVRGPGSFTGIRLALATAAALRRAGRARLAGLDYLQALACTAAINRQLPFDVRIMTITHARRDLVHFRPFLSIGPSMPPLPLADARLVTPRAALEAALEFARGNRFPIYICGSGLARNAPAFEGSGGGPLVPMPECLTPGVLALRMLARHGEYFDEDIEPVYLRPCDAVENLPHLVARQGMEGGEAAARLEELLGRTPKSDI